MVGLAFGVVAPGRLVLLAGHAEGVTDECPEVTGPHTGASTATRGVAGCPRRRPRCRAPGPGGLDRVLLLSPPRFLAGGAQGFPHAVGSPLNPLAIK